MTDGQYDRFRSFAERYLVARAAHFEVGKELEQGWQCIMDAKKLYHMMARASNDAEQEPVATQGPTQGPPVHSHDQLQSAINMASELTRNGIPQPASLKALINKLMKGSIP